MATSSQTAATAPDGGDLSRFQLQILKTLAAEGTEYGLGIKRVLESYYGEDINHGRLYPNIDSLVEKGLVEKYEIDKRTNGHRLTDDGEDLIARHARDWADVSARMEMGGDA